jgi:hypothetical protein
MAESVGENPILYLFLSLVMMMMMMIGPRAWNVPLFLRRRFPGEWGADIKERECVCK